MEQAIAWWLAHWHAWSKARPQSVPYRLAWYVRRAHNDTTLAPVEGHEAFQHAWTVGNLRYTAGCKCTYRTFQRVVTVFCMMFTNADGAGSCQGGP